MRWVALTVLAASAAVSADPAPAPSIALGTARALLGDHPACADIPCLLDAAYADDAKARALALDLFTATGDVAGVGKPELMEGYYRGKIRLVPQLPTGVYRQHLVWVAAAMTDIDQFFTALYADEPAPRYRWRALAFRFVRSPGKRTPSAYATSWAIEYNVNGSLLKSADSVRETLFHELFHNNDEEHGDWSATHLKRDYDAILAKCGSKSKCLAPFAPNSTIVLATGTFYAFQQNNGNPVHEYAAELSVRYLKEQSEMLHAGKLSRPAFKCGPPENARAWTAFTTEFFAGRDLVPACR